MNSNIIEKNKSTQKALTDIISLEQLQKLQDKFTARTNVASIIIDIQGNPITKPSNFSKICTLINKTELGNLQCEASNDDRKKISESIDQPTYLKCHPCGFADASIPVFLNEQRVANWLIGQVNLNDADRNEIIDYAAIIGVDISEMLIAFEKMPKMSSSEFESIVKLLFKISSDIMHMCYKEIQKDDTNEKNLYSAVQDKFDSMLSEFTFSPVN